MYSKQYLKKLAKLGLEGFPIAKGNTIYEIKVKSIGEFEDKDKSEKIELDNEHPFTVNIVYEPKNDSSKEAIKQTLHLQIPKSLDKSFTSKTGLQQTAITVAMKRSLIYVNKVKNTDEDYIEDEYEYEEGETPSSHVKVSFFQKNEENPYEHDIWRAEIDFTSGELDYKYEGGSTKEGVSYYPKSIKGNLRKALFENDLNTLSDFLKEFIVPEKIIFKLNYTFKKNLKFFNRKLDREIYETLEEYSKLSWEERVTTPVDFSFYNEKDNLLRHIKMTSRSKKGFISYNFKKGNDISSALQSPIKSFFRIQAEELQSIQYEQSTNPVSISSQGSKIYFYGKRSNKSTGTSSNVKLPIYNPSLIGIVDPIKTSEGVNINIKNELSKIVKINGENITISMINNKGIPVEISYIMFSSSVVLTTTSYDYENNKVSPDDEGNIIVFKYGEYIKTPAKTAWDYRYPEETSIYSVSSSLIPFINSTNHTRALLGAHMIDQSIPVKGAELNPIYTGTEKEIFKKSSAMRRDSEVKGQVTKIEEDYIEITDENNVIHTVEKPSHINSVSHTTNSFNSSLKLGQSVNAGDTIYSANSFINGELAIGVPVKIAYTSYYLNEYEDGIILSESVAKKFEHEVIESIDFEVFMDEEYVFNKLELNDRIKKHDTSHLDMYGIIKEGTTIKKGEVLAVYGKKHTKTRGTQIAQEVFSRRKIKDTAPIYEIITKKVPHRVIEGTVSKVNVTVKYGEKTKLESKNDDLRKLFREWKKDRKDKVSSSVFKNNKVLLKFQIEVKYINPVKLGDKFTNRYGSKGTVTKIVPDKDMLQDESGNPIDIIVAGSTPVSRQNPSQVFEAELAKVSKILYQRFNNFTDKEHEVYKDIFGKETKKEMKERYDSHKGFFRIKVSPMNKKYTRDKLAYYLEQLGLNPDGTEYLYNPISKKRIRNPIVTGYNSFTRLHFIVENKAKATSSVDYLKDDEFVLGHGKRREEGGQKIGWQEHVALLASSDTEIIQELGHRKTQQEEYISALVTLGIGLDL